MEGAASIHGDIHEAAPSQLWEKVLFAPTNEPSIAYMEFLWNQYALSDFWLLHVQQRLCRAWGMKGFFFKRQTEIITEICAETLLARWAPHFDYNSPAGDLWPVAGSNDPWRCGLASPSIGSWINSAGVRPHFAEDDPSPEALEGDRLVRQWIT